MTSSRHSWESHIFEVVRTIFLALIGVRPMIVNSVIFLS